MLRSKMLSVVFCALIASTTFVTAQEAPQNESQVKKADTTATLNEDGTLAGSVFATVDGEKQPLEAKITVATADGVVIDTIESKEDGSFSFASLEPGVYQMYGSADSYYGGQSVDVMPYSGAGTCQSCNLGLESSVAYDSYSAAPVAACGGCGGGGGFGGGGGILGNRRFLRLALIGGVVAIATSDSSPDR
jgi:hypothetical protein